MGPWHMHAQASLSCGSIKHKTSSRKGQSYRVLDAQLFQSSSPKQQQRDAHLRACIHMSHVVVIEDTSTLEIVVLPYELVLLPATHEVQRRSDVPFGSLRGVSSLLGPHFAQVPLFSCRAHHLMLDRVVEHQPKVLLHSTFSARNTG